MLKSMCTVLVEYAILVDVEYAILVDWKHKQAHAQVRLHSDTWMHADEYYSDCILYTSNICADHTYTHKIYDVLIMCICIIKTWNNHI